MEEDNGIGGPARWRRGLGEHVGSAYATRPTAAAVLIGGSTGRGHADRYSDVELLVCWDEPPRDDERAEIATSLAADHRLLPFNEEFRCWEDELFVGRAAPDAANTGVVIEVMGMLTADVERWVADVLERHEPSLAKQSLISALLQGIPVAGGELIDGWAARAQPYPRGLAVAMVKAYGQIDSFSNWKRFLARGRNLMMIHESFAQVQQQLLLVLQALNCRYYFKFKWLDRVLGELAIAPPRLAERLALVHTSEVPEGASLLRDLVEETYDLVETHLPDVDVNRLRRIFRWDRTEWEDPPPEMFLRYRS